MIKTRAKTCFLSVVAVLAVATALGAQQAGSSLLEAVRTGNVKALRSLLDRQANVNSSLGDGAKPLHWAAYYQHLDVARILIDAGADVNAANDYGVTALSLACTNGHADMVAELLRANANPNASQWTGETVLMTCARAGNLDAVAELVAKGANVKAATRRGQTALMWAVAQKHSDVARHLIQHGAEVNARSHKLAGFAPLLYVTFGLYDHVHGEFDKIDPTGGHHDPASSKGGFTPLMFAARSGDLESAKLLVEAGADVNANSEYYGAALVVSAASGHEDVGIYLVEHGADTNAADEFGLTALHYAIREGVTAINLSRDKIPTDNQWHRSNMPGLVKALLDHGADPNARIRKDFPPLNYLPYVRDDNTALPLFRQVGATPFLLAAATGDLGLMRMLLQKGADAKLATEHGTTSLMAAAGLGRSWDRTPKESAAALEAAKIIVALGVDVNAKNWLGRTALHGAASLGANAIIEFLVERGAMLDPQDKYGTTPLVIAMGKRVALGARDRRFNFRPINQHEDTVELLRTLGAKDVSDTKGPSSGN